MPMRIVKKLLQKHRRNLQVNISTRYWNRVIWFYHDIFILGPNSTSTTPGKSKTPNGGDRYISRRSAISLEMAQYKVITNFVLNTSSLEQIKYV